MAPLPSQAPSDSACGLRVSRARAQVLLLLRSPNYENCCGKVMQGDLHGAPFLFSLQREGYHRTRKNAFKGVLLAVS